MKIVLSDSSFHSLALAAFDCDQCTMTLAYTTFAILGQCITMADALASSVSTTRTGINFTSNCSDWPSTLKIQKDRIINYCNDFIGCTVKQPLSTSGNLVLPEWESLFEEALIELEQSFENTESVNLIDTASMENCSKMSATVNNHVYYPRQRIRSDLSSAAYKEIFKSNADNYSTNPHLLREREFHVVYPSKWMLPTAYWLVTYLLCSLVWRFHIMMVIGAWSDFCDCTVCSLTSSFSDVTKPCLFW
jgi:hypothetical protein